MASGEEMRSKFLGNSSGELGSEIGAPVPLLAGLPRAFLHSELGGEELPAVVNQLGERNIEFVAILKMRGDGHFTPDWRHGLRGGALP